MPTHERYETQLCKTGHNFYALQVDGSKVWNKDQTAIPSNYHILPKNNFYEIIDFDLILSQSKFGQFQLLKNLNLDIPFISLEHTVPTAPDHVNNFSKLTGDLNIFISNYSQQAWGIDNNSLVLHHGVDSDLFTNHGDTRQNVILTVANDFVNRDYCLNFSGWRRVVNNLPHKLIGDTPGLSLPASSTEELISEYNNAKIYFNSSTLSPIPSSLLEAMSCGCAVVSTATCMIPEIIQNGVNGFISNDESQLSKYLELLLKDDELAKKLGDKARETIQKQFGEQNFVNNWNKVFKMALSKRGI